MKIFWLSFFFVLFQTFVFAQTKFDEYALTDSDSEAMRLYNFFDELKERTDDKGLIVIYAERNSERMGNVISFTNGVKRQLGYFPFRDRVSIVVAEGQKFLFKEMWLIGRDDRYPEFKPLDLSFTDLRTKSFYAEDCLDCLPAAPDLYHGNADLENYAEVLKKNPRYRAVIEIYASSYAGHSRRKQRGEALRYAGRYRRTLTQDYGIRNDRITIRIKRSAKKDYPATANLYLVPSNRPAALPVENE